MESHYDILGLGAPFVDQILYVDEKFLQQVPGSKGGMVAVDYPQLKSLIKKSGIEPIPIPGGSCANTMRGLAQLGNACAFTGKIGRDPMGKKFVESLLRVGITPKLVLTSTPTGQALCIITPDGERTMRSFLGSGKEMSPKDLHPSTFSGAKLVHIEGYTLLNEGLTKQAMELAKAAGAKVSLDLGSFEVVSQFKETLIELIAQYVDVLFGNQNEIQTLTQLPPQKACQLLSDICETVVVLLGGEGCLVGNHSKQVQCPALAVPVIDTTGAGDLFVSGFLHGYLKGHSIEECGYFGTLVGAEVVQVRGVDISPEQWSKLNKHIHKE